MPYYVRWTGVDDGYSMLDGFEFETPEQAAEDIKELILSDFNHGLSGAYIYEIIKG